MKIYLSRGLPARGRVVPGSQGSRGLGCF